MLPPAPAGSLYLSSYVKLTLKKAFTAESEPHFFNSAIKSASACFD
jgi:hypothetical protein